jgi:activator of HSP90 ATPase
MMSDEINATGPTDGFTRRKAVAGFAITLTGAASGSNNAWARSEEEVSHTAESIHQELVFKASRKRVYEALTDSKQFDKVTELSGAMKSMALGNKATEISRDEGGSFVLFGGHIIGRHVELVPNELIVQAWRVDGWDPGVYSIAKFELVEMGSGTKVVFDHNGFPKGLGKHLATGWTEHYWQPLQKLLG